MSLIPKFLRFPVPQNKFGSFNPLGNPLPNLNVDTIVFELYTIDPIISKGLFYECLECKRTNRSCGSRSFEANLKIVPQDIVDHLKTHVELYHVK